MTLSNVSVHALHKGEPPSAHDGEPDKIAITDHNSDPPYADTHIEDLVDDLPPSNLNGARIRSDPE